MQLSLISPADIVEERPVKVDFTACFERFWKAYPRTPNMSKKIARKAYDGALRSATPDEIFTGLEGYIAWLKEPKQKDHPVCHASTWLNQARWEGFAEMAVVEHPELQTVRRGSPQHAAWLAYYQKQGRYMNGSAQFLDNLTVPAEWPPKGQ